MAAVINDFNSDTSHFHPHRSTMTGSGPQPLSAEYRQRSRSRTEHPSTPNSHSASSAPPLAPTPPPTSNARAVKDEDETEWNSEVKMDPPSPPSSSSPIPGSYSRSYTNSSQKNFPESASRYGEGSRQGPEDPKLKSAAPFTSPQNNTTPIARGHRSLGDFRSHGGNVIKVRDLAHIQDFASEEFLSFRGQSGRRQTADDSALKYEISGMPITDIIEMVAGLLTKITTTNDRQHENLHRPIPTTGDSTNMSGLSSSVLAFHGKNVPSITILSYLSRIHKYCPTTYEVFLSLLVYFDRMTERVNAAPVELLHQEQAVNSDSRLSTSDSDSDSADSLPAGARSVPEIASDFERAQQPHVHRDSDLSAFQLSHFFVVDSFNIHRLVIAGVTCASKFFSDVFYTNSRYAKVGGLPLAELNHLELQFLLLNDFRLSVPVEELEAYGTMLVEFYAREVIANRQEVAPEDEMAYHHTLTPRNHTKYNEAHDLSP
ncbi:cyclin-domain-containing protein [Calycina marina]|uniref:Cyclin-domain-containing protein n=1 Tax=Calycina marina TaxID=1763456 RepID=A0A9P7Z586_9HELO|nr:cyclin-domain-containing protein [Calycina marina]